MKRTQPAIALCSLCLLLMLALSACKPASDAIGHTHLPQPEDIVPAKDALLCNLSDNGYIIRELTSIEGSELLLDRIVAEKGNRFIDITYGLTATEAESVFDAYCTVYPDDYYILAQNGTYVYCVSDKKTFSKAGFSSTDNVGVQYIHE